MNQTAATTYGQFFRQLRSSTPSLVTVGNSPAPETPRPKLKWNATPLIGLATITHPGAIVAILFALVIVFMLIEGITGIKMGTLLAATSWVVLAWIVWPVLRWGFHSIASRRIDTESYFQLLLAHSRFAPHSRSAWCFMRSLVACRPCLPMGR